MSVGTATVVGLGKIGLPLAVQIAESGWHVEGVDVARRVVDSVNRGAEPFPGEPFLQDRLAAVVADDRLVATTSIDEAVAASSVVVVVVPLVIDDRHEPDFGQIDEATEGVARALRPGTLVSYETTLPVGTTRRRFAGRLAAGSGLSVGVDLYVCHSPERVSSGRIFADLRRYPKLVGATDPTSALVAVAFYESVLSFDDRPDLPRRNGVWDLGSSEAAELAKLAETTYRDINIAFANELAMAADDVGVDVREVIAACNSQPYSHIHTPGVAVGGHCIPVYPHLLAKSTSASQLATRARWVNESMPEYAVQRLIAEMGSIEGKTVVVLGLAYRGGVKETFHSGAWPLVELLERAGATASVHDPLFTDDEMVRLGLRPHHFGEGADAAIIQADHVEYRNLGDDDLPGVQVVLDGRGHLAAPPGSRVRVLRLGAPSLGSDSDVRT